MEARYNILLAALVLATLILATFIPTAAHAQTVIYEFGENSINDPTHPEAAGLIVQGHDGNVYSTAPFGG